MLNTSLPLVSLQRMREEMEEITQQQLVHDRYCKELMGFGTKPRHITPFTSFQSVQPQQANALLGLLGYSTPQGFLSFGATPVPAKSSLVESRYCRELMEERFDQVHLTESNITVHYLRSLPAVSSPVHRGQLREFYKCESRGLQAKSGHFISSGP